MKKIIPAILPICLYNLLSLSGQERILEDRFYQVHSQNKNNYWNITANTYHTSDGKRVPGNTFLWYYDYILEAYVNTIKAETNQQLKKEYTDFAIDIIAYMLDKRDDNDTNRDALVGGVFSMPNITRMDEKPPMSAQQNIKKWWAAKDYYNEFKFEGSAGISGRLTWPMAELANYILKNQGFYGNKYYRDGNTSTPISNRYIGTPYQVTGSNWTQNGYRKIAEDIIVKVDETFQEHFDRCHWYNIGQHQGAFAHESWVADNAGDWTGITSLETPYYLEPNFQAAAGLSRLSLYNAYTTLQSPRAFAYKEKLRRLGNYLRGLIHSRSDGDWYWYYQNPTLVSVFEGAGYSYSNAPEDVGHAFLFADFAYYMALNGSDISHDFNSGVPVFNSTSDMANIKNIVNNIYADKKPLWFYRFINGNDAINNVYTAPAYSVSIDSFKYTKLGIPFIKYAKWDINIYHRMSDVFYEYILHTSLGSFEFKLLSDLILYAKDPVSQNTLKNLFRPLNVSRDPGNGSQWIAAEGGDLNGDNKAYEFVAVRNADHTFYIYKANTDGTLSSIAHKMILPGNGGSWFDLAVGNFDTNNPGQEFVAVKNYNGFEHFYLFRLNGNNINQIATYDGFGNGSTWRGICAADLDGNNVDEMVAVRNNDGTLTGFSYNGTGSLAGFGTLITNITNWKTIEGGDIDGDGKDEIVGITDNGVCHIYYWDSGAFKSALVDGANSNVNIRAATLGDFDRNKKQDNLIIGDHQGFLYKYNISYQGIISGKKKFKVVYQTEEKIDNSWFTQAMVLGKITLAPLECDEDKLLLIRNSISDGHMFIFDAGFAKDNSWSCRVKRPHVIQKKKLEGNKIIKN